MAARHLPAAYDLESGRLIGRFHARKTWEQSLGFPKWPRRRYRKGETLHVVLDNYGPHVKAEVLAWAREHKVRFYLTATNASRMDRIECHFTELKEFALANSDYRTHEALREAIEPFMEWRDGKRPISKQCWQGFKKARRAAG